MTDFKKYYKSCSVVKKHSIRRAIEKELGWNYWKFYNYTSGKIKHTPKKELEFLQNIIDNK